MLMWRRGKPPRLCPEEFPLSSAFLPSHPLFVCTTFVVEILIEFRFM